MAKTTDLYVGYVSKLARVNLTDEETQLFQKQLGDVLKYAEKVREVDVSHVEAAAHAIPIFNVFRKDEPRDWLTADEPLSNARHKADHLFTATKGVEYAGLVLRRSPDPVANRLFLVEQVLREQRSKLVA